MYNSKLHSRLRNKIQCEDIRWSLFVVDVYDAMNTDAASGVSSNYTYYKRQEMKLHLKTVCTTLIVMFEMKQEKLRAISRAQIQPYCLEFSG